MGLKLRSIWKYVVSNLISFENYQLCQFLTVKFISGITFIPLRLSIEYSHVVINHIWRLWFQWRNRDRFFIYKQIILCITVDIFTGSNQFGLNSVCTCTQFSLSILIDPSKRFSKNIVSSLNIIWYHLSCCGLGFWKSLFLSYTIVNANRCRPEMPLY